VQTDGDKWELKTWNEKVIKTDLCGRSTLKGQRSGLGCSGIEGGEEEEEEEDKKKKKKKKNKNKKNKKKKKYEGGGEWGEGGEEEEFEGEFEE